MAKREAVLETQASWTGRALWRSWGASPPFQAELSPVQVGRVALFLIAFLVRGPQEPP